MAPASLIIHYPISVVPSLAPSALTFPFLIFSLCLPTCILHPSHTQVFMIIGTQDKQNMYNVIVQSTLPLYSDYSKAKTKKKKPRKDSAKKIKNVRKMND